MHASAFFHSLAFVTFLSLPEVSLTKYLKVVPERDEKAPSFPFDILEIRRLVQHLHAIHRQFLASFPTHLVYGSYALLNPLKEDRKAG